MIFNMNFYDSSLYEEILICYNYETKNSSIYGNVIRGEMEFAKSGKKLWTDEQRNEDNI